MQQQHNLVRVKELTKGVESIVEVDWKNREWVKPCPNLKKFLFEIQSLHLAHSDWLGLCLSFCITLPLYRLRFFKAPEETDEEAAPTQHGGEEETLYRPPEITTQYSVSARLEPLFLEANKRCVCVCLRAHVRFRQNSCANLAQPINSTCYLYFLCHTIIN